jgi:hypothetical protein
MIRVLKFTFQAVIAAIWLVLIYAVIDRIGQEIEFTRSMGGLF